MSKVIIVFANCQNSKALGDFSLAGSIAKDLARLLQQTYQDVKVLLSSTKQGLSQFHRLYGSANVGSVTIDGVVLLLGALEKFKASQHEVVAFIEANRCKPAEDSVLARVISPITKIIQIRAANQLALDSHVHSGTDYFSNYYSRLCKKQPSVYPSLPPDQFMVKTCGLGTNRLGIPKLASIDVPSLSVWVTPASFSPNPFGVMYPLASDKESLSDIIAQYIALTEYNNFVLLGQFDKNPIVQTKFDEWEENSTYNFLCVKSVDNQAMRQWIHHSGSTVLMTGVMSTLEAMYEGKLVFYDYQEHNLIFVQSVIDAVSSLSTRLDNERAQQVRRLNTLLFSQKPLRECCFEELTQLRENQLVTTA